MLVCRRMEETMFQIGESVVHGTDGICEVKDITQLERPGGSSAGGPVFRAHRGNGRDV